VQQGLARQTQRIEAGTAARSLLPRTEPLGTSAPSAGIRRSYRALYRWMALTDVACVLAALLIAYQLRFSRLWPSRDFWLVLFVAPFVTVAFGYGFGLYRVHQFSSLEEFRRIIISNSMTITTIVMLAFWSRVSYSRLWIGTAWLLALVFTGIVRRLWHREIRHNWVEGKLTFDTLIVGANPEAEHLADLLQASKLGFRPLGFVATAPPHAPGNGVAGNGNGNGVAAHPRTIRGLPVVGDIYQLRELVHHTGANCLFVASTAVDPDAMKHVLKARRLDGVEIRLTANFPAVPSSSRVTAQSVGGLMALSVNAVRLTRGQAVAKRTFDVVMSAIGLVLLSPLLAAIALAIKLHDRGPVLFRQVRVGLHRQPFTLLKFRTMVPHAELLLAELLSRNEADGPLFKVRDDPRITRVGRFLRRYSLDELPQLWNVLRGEMSLVGPRPPLPSEVEAYEDWQLDRLEVRPGITGLWQVSGRSELSFDEYVRLDLFYIENWSLAYDLFMIAKTIPMLLNPRGAY
jgi:exopolysaccharide biosynthesis polyprenyl glycosylphosphotransferase